MMHYSAAWVAAALAVAAAGPARAAWHEARSTHFIVYADSSPKALQEFATRLEQFDQAVRIAIGADDPKVGDGNRLTIYVMPSEKDVQELAGDTTGFLSGFYTGRATGPLAYIARGKDGVNNDDVLYHEYTHHLMLQQLERPYPEWYVEGFAEFFSTPRFERDGSVKFGTPPRSRAYGLLNGKKLSVESMLAGAYGEMSKLPKEPRQALYSWSWLLAHYLLMDPGRKGQLTGYINGLAKGLPAPQAAKAAFGDMNQLQRDVDSYLTSRLAQFKILPEKIRVGPVAVRPLSKGAAEVVLLNGKLKHMANGPQAKSLLPQIRAVQAQYPGDELVETTLAEAELEAGNPAAAEAAADRAAAANPRGVEALVLKGRALLERGLAADDDQGAPYFAQARDAFSAANKLDTEDPEPLLRFYEAFVRENGRPTANAVAALHYASDLAPQDFGIRVNSAMAYIHDDKLEEARATLIPVAYSPHAAEASTIARAMIASIDAGASKRDILAVASAAMAKKP